MDLSKIISISGMGGLFKVIAQGKNGLIVESLVDKKRMPVQPNYKISVLDNISIYVNSGETIPLGDLLKKIYEKQNAQPALDSKSSDDELKKFFESILPEYDKEKRACLVREQCSFTDGKSAWRIAQYLLSVLDNNKDEGKNKK